MQAQTSTPLSEILLDLKLSQEEAHLLDLGPIQYLGFDLVRTIRRRFNKHISKETVIATPPIDNSFLVLRTLVRLHQLRRELVAARRGFEKALEIDPIGVWVISRVNPLQTQSLSEAWADRHDMYSTTLIPKTHIKYCHNRIDKVGLCEELGITAFVDDKWAVLIHFSGAVEKYVFKSDSLMAGELSGATFKDVTKEQYEKIKSGEVRAHMVRNWLEIGRRLIPEPVFSRIFGENT